jgi:hypothetical protein
MWYTDSDWQLIKLAPPTLVLLTNIGLQCKCLVGTNAPAYFSAASVTKIKSFERLAVGNNETETNGTKVKIDPNTDPSTVQERMS